MLFVLVRVSLQYTEVRLLDSDNKNDKNKIWP